MRRVQATNRECDDFGINRLVPRSPHRLRGGGQSWGVPLPPLSVLDLAPVVVGSTVSDALRNSLDLARHAEGWGYARFWLAEHHNAIGIASAATSVVIAHVAAGTTRIR